MARKAPPLVYVEPASVAKMAEIGRILQRAGKAERKRLTKEMNDDIRRSTKPIVDDLKSAAMGLNFANSGSRTKSRSQRTARTLKSGKVKAGKSLRQTMAQGVKVKTSTGKWAGVRIKMDPSGKDRADVQSIAAELNFKGFVRHPTRTGPRFSQENREKWSNTGATNGKGWWSKTAEPHLPRVRRSLQTVLDHHVSRIAREIDRAT